LYCAKHRAAIKEKHGKDLKMPEVSKILAAEWKQVNEEDKKEYEDLAAHDKIRYADECKKTGFEPKQSKAAKKKSSGAPKGAKSAYLFFSIAKRPELASKGIPFTDIAKQLGADWKLMTADDKKPYEEQAKEDKERFSKEKEAFIAAGGVIEKRTTKKKGGKPAKKKAKKSKAASDDEDGDASGDDD